MAAAVAVAVAAVWRGAVGLPCWWRPCRWSAASGTAGWCCGSLRGEETHTRYTVIHFRNVHTQRGKHTSELMRAFKVVGGV